MMMKKNVLPETKVMAVLLAVFMLAGILFSYYFIIENTHHDCTGEKCPICLQIEEAVQFIQTMKYVPVLSFIMAVLCVFTKWVAHETRHIFVKQTLLSLKVELLD